MQASTAFRFFPVIVTVVAALGCGGAPSSNGAAPLPKLPNETSVRQVPSVQGNWTVSLVGDGLVAHEAVPLKIEINGSHVLGKFGADKGKIDGEMKGNVIQGSWEESDGSGNFKWVLSKDGKTFQGTFGGMLHSQKVPEGATWSGTHD